MTKNNSFPLIILLCLIPIIMFLHTKAYASELPPGLVVGDSNGLNATKNGEYHVNITDVMPGKQWNTTISIINMEKDVPYQLSLKLSPPETSGSLDLSKEIQMTLTYEGKLIYEGPASGISETMNLQNTPIDLGIFNAGDSRSLEVEYSLDGKYTNKDFAQKNTMDNTWVYTAVKTGLVPKDPSTGKRTGRLPSTGEIKQAMIGICLALFFVMTMLLILKKKKEQVLKSSDEEG